METKVDHSFYKSKKILNEIYETEKTYQHHLMLLKTLFIDVIKFSALLPVNFVDGIFSNVEAIQSVSLHLLKLMKEEGVIHALLQFAPYLKLYSLYANNFDTSNKLLGECTKKYPEFGRLVYLQENQEEMQSLKLTSLLVTPIQRIPRYCLLLGNLLEETENNEEHDMVKLKDAHEKLKNVATHINECVRQHENFHKMLSIQNRFVGANLPQIMMPGRIFIKEGSVTKLNSRGQTKDRVVFLFSDILILAKKEGNGFSWCDTFRLNNCIVEDVMGNRIEHGNGLFRIICDDKSILLCSKDESITWILKIRNCVRELHNNLASLRRKSSETNIIRGAQINNRPRSKKNALKTLTLAVPVQPNKLLRRQKTQSMEVRSLSTFQDDDAKNMDGVPHFYHHDDSYGCSLSTTIKSDDEFAVSRISNLKPPNPRRQIWSLTEPGTIERRRPLRSIQSGAKQVYDKLGCKRKQEIDRMDNVKKPKQMKEIDNNNHNLNKFPVDISNNKRVNETVPKTSVSNAERSIGCVVM